MLDSSNDHLELLNMAVVEGNIEAIKHLLAKKVALNQAINNGPPLLCLAALMGDTNILVLLLADEKQTLIKQIIVAKPHFL